MKRLLLFLVAMTMCIFSLPLSSNQARADAPTCNQYTVPVTLSLINPTSYNVVTWLCSQGPSEGKTVQVLIHGGTYDHHYWDFPSNPQKYSYVQHLTNAGYAVLNMDRIGIGLSDHPPALQVTLESNAYVLHQLVQALRNGSLNGVSFSKIMLVGHSFGSVVALTEASQFADVDGIVTTGLMHTINATGAVAVITSFYPASNDPKFAQINLPPGYLTTQPGIRDNNFYNTANADAAIISQDEALKETLTDGELVTTFVGLSPTTSLPIHLPVLVAVGEKDKTVCGLLVSCATNAIIVTRETAFYPLSVCLEGFVLPSSGHSINLHENSEQWFEAAIDWANRRMGSSSTSPPTQPCT